jgi:hypothetical protein
MRRIPWEGDLPALERHLDAVCAQLDASDAIEQYRLGGDLGTTALHFEIVVVAETDQQADDTARGAIADAIRIAGGAHEGLLTLKEESLARSNVNAWSGLRTPRWQLRTAKLTRTEG